MHASAYWETGLTADDAFEQMLQRVDLARAAGADLADPAVLQALTFDAE